MSNSEEQFWDLAEEMIGSANQKTSDADTVLVSDALLYAAARFAAYTAAAGTEERKQFKEEQGEIKDMLMQQFETMLDSNLADYLENYKIYMKDAE
jgi:hypothetical protein